MKNNMVQLVQIKNDDQQGTLFFKRDNQTLWFTKERYQKDRADWSLLNCLIVSGILVTPYWVGKSFLPLPSLTITHTWLWWLGLAVTTLLPLIFWWQIYRRPAWRPKEMTEMTTLTTSQRRELAGKWQFERLWVVFVLVILPPTTLMFLFFYWWKSDFLDALLITVHGTLFLRRLQPGVWSRLALSPKTFYDANKKRTTV